MEENNALALTETIARLANITEALEQTLARTVAHIGAANENAGRIVATVESSREEELLRRLEEAEARIATLVTLSATHSAAGRKTLSTGTTSMLAKSGISLEHTGVAMEASAVDAALTSLSIEQRIAVKAELLRAGLLG
jgi:hypothetical protein